MKKVPREGHVGRSYDTIVLGDIEAKKVTNRRRGKVLIKVHKSCVGKGNVDSGHRNQRFRIRARAPSKIVKNITFANTL